MSNPPTIEIPAEWSAELLSAANTKFGANIPSLRELVLVSRYNPALSEWISQFLTERRKEDAHPQVFKDLGISTAEYDEYVRWRLLHRAVSREESEALAAAASAYQEALKGIRRRFDEKREALPQNPRFTAIADAMALKIDDLPMSGQVELATMRSRGETEDRVSLRTNQLLTDLRRERLGGSPRLV